MFFFPPKRCFRFPKIFLKNPNRAENKTIHAFSRFLDILFLEKIQNLTILWTWTIISQTQKIENLKNRLSLFWIVSTLELWNSLFQAGLSSFLLLSLHSHSFFPGFVLSIAMDIRVRTLLFPPIQDLSDMGYLFVCFWFHFFFYLMPKKKKSVLISRFVFQILRR